jgi:hypothetical protein
VLALHCFNAEVTFPVLPSRYIYHAPGEKKILTPKLERKHPRLEPSSYQRRCVRRIHRLHQPSWNFCHCGQLCCLESLSRPDYNWVRRWAMQFGPSRFRSLQRPDRERMGGIRERGRLIDRTSLRIEYVRTGKRRSKSCEKARQLYLCAGFRSPSFPLRPLLLPESCSDFILTISPWLLPLE